MLAIAGYCSSGLYGYCYADLNSSNVLSLDESPLSWQNLDRQRGGFIDANGLNIQIGLEKIVLIDGMVAARSHLVIPSINARSNMSQAMASAKGGMAESKGTMNNAMESSGKSMESSGKSIEQQMALSPHRNQTSSGTSLDLKSNAQTGIRTDTSTLSLGKANQTSLYQPGSAAGAASVAPQQPIQASLQPSMMANQPLTQVAQFGNTTLIQNSADNRLIQTVQIMNIELSNLSQFRGQRIQSRMLPQMIQYSR